MRRNAAKDRIQNPTVPSLIARAAGASSYLWILAFCGVACAPQAPTSYYLVDAPDGAAEVVAAAAKLWCDSPAGWCPVLDQDARELEIRWEADYVTQGRPKDSNGAQKDDWIAFEAEHWIATRNIGRLWLATHELGHTCIDGHIPTSLVGRGRVVDLPDALVLRIDAVLASAFRAGCS